MIYNFLLSRKETLTSYFGFNLHGKVTCELYRSRCVVVVVSLTPRYIQCHLMCLLLLASNPMPWYKLSPAKDVGKTKLSQTNWRKIWPAEQSAWERIEL